MKIMNSLKSFFVTLLLFALTLSCAQDCPENINLLPMYGEQIKCEQQKKIDEQFLKECDKQFKSRTDASDYYVSKGWEYFYKNDFDTSMKRFNQAWLLDKTNADIFWGFGNILGMKKQFKESIPLLEKSIQLNPKNPKVYESVSTSYGQLFFQTKNVKYLNLSIANLKKSVKIDSQNSGAYAQLAKAYAYFYQKDSLRKYIKITDKLDSKLIPLEIRKMASEE